ncbi:hypothetical protein ANRL2_01574 [Anaerolineae bacterium]|nr:hypothetical protein ANRL2_01574 [Anaerolineae bacterium]
MAMKHSFEWIENGILLSTWEGPISKEDLRDVTLARLQLTHDRTDPYVLLLDMRNATNKLLDIQMNKWAVNLDPKVIGVVVVTKTDMAVTTISTLIKLMSNTMSFTHSFDEGHEMARNLLLEHVPA